VAALGLGGVVAALTLEGALDGVACAAFAQQILAPQLGPGQVVIGDNVKPHQDATARAAVEARGCALVFLPAYSPDLSPIELAFSKVKEALRRAEARTREDLETAIGAALATRTPDDAAGWFQHCGYRSQPLLT
jgi:transposase